GEASCTAASRGSVRRTRCRPDGGDEPGRSQLRSFPSSAWERKNTKLCFVCCISGHAALTAMRRLEAELRVLRSQAELGNEEHPTSITELDATADALHP